MPKEKAIRFIQVGCGPIGAEVLRLALRRAGFRLVGVVDIDPAKVGRDAGEVVGLPRKLGIRVADDLPGLLAKARPALALHATGSHLVEVAGQLGILLGAGVNVVSTCEELAFPARSAPLLAGDLDRLARRKRVRLIGTGINPGFLMDAWPLVMTAPCEEVRSVEVIRVQDASARRLPFQRKIGAGLAPEEFARRVLAGTLGHVGLGESVAMLAEGLGFRLERIDEEVAPVIAKAGISSKALPVRKGEVRGLRQVARGFCAGRQVITLMFEAALGTKGARDAVRIRGTPDLEVVIPGGVHGDVGTAAMVVNVASRLLAAPPGLLTMRDLPLPSCRK